MPAVGPTCSQAQGARSCTPPLPSRKACPAARRPHHRHFQQLHLPSSTSNLPPSTITPKNESSHVHQAHQQRIRRNLAIPPRGLHHLPPAQRVHPHVANHARPAARVALPPGQVRHPAHPPRRVPLQAAGRALHHARIPPQRDQRLPRQRLPGHPQARELEALDQGRRRPRRPAQPARRAPARRPARGENRRRVPQRPARLGQERPPPRRQVRPRGARLPPRHQVGPTEPAGP